MWPLVGSGTECVQKMEGRGPQRFAGPPWRLSFGQFWARWPM